MEKLIILASLAVIVGITSLGIVLFGKDGKALKAAGVVCFVPFAVVIVGGCVLMPDAGYVKFWVICCLLIVFASITIASDFYEE